MFGKPFYLSTTFYGLVFMGVSAAINWLCGQGIIPGGACTAITGVLGPLGTILSFLGIRKNQTPAK